MRRASLAGLALALAACAPAPPPATAPTAAPKAPKASVAPKAGPSADATPAGPAFLRRPAGAVRILAGQVAIDARYAVTAGAGQIVSNNGGNVLALAGFTLAAGAGNIISNNGGSVVANNGAGFRLLQADAPPPLGTIAPAAGMAIRVRDLVAGADLALGTDAAGAPVREILTDDQGRYELYLPADAPPNVLVQAQAPGNADARFALAIVTPQGVADDRLDEDTTIANRIFRKSFVGFTTQWLSARPGATLENPPWVAAADAATYQANFQRLLVAAAAGGVQDRDAAGQRAVAEKLADLIFARYDLRQAQIDPAANGGQAQDAFGASVKVLRAQREAVTTKFRELEAGGQDPAAFFAQRPYVRDANAGRATPYEIRRPADFVDLIVQEYAGLERPMAETFAVIDQIQADAPIAFDEFVRLNAATLAVRTAVDDVVFLDRIGLLPELEALLRAQKP